MRLGIIGGGQLAKMMLQVAQRWGLYTGVFDPNPNCSAYSIAHNYTKGSFSNSKAVADFAKDFDVLSYDLESVNVESLLGDASLSEKFTPRPQTLSLVQDKLLQKQFYLDHGLPTAKIYDSSNVEFPCVWKARKGGYDGYGVSVLKSQQDFENFADKVPDLFEEKVDIDKELSVVIARNYQGDMVHYPVVEMVVDHEKNILDRLFCPAQISPNTEKEAIKISLSAVEKLEGAGLFAVELLLDKRGQILINEIAPRPHNSGHHSIESFNVSQFEMHLRAVCGFPLQKPKPRKAFSGIVNLLADTKYSGEVRFEGFDQLMTMEDVYLHIYGKQEAKPGRKMGHVTVMADNFDQLMKKMDEVKSVAKVKAEEKK